MTGPARALARRSRRERALVAVAAVLLPCAVALGVLLPLHERRLEAEAALTDSIALHDWLRARVAEKQARAAPPAPPMPAAIGPGAVESGIAAAGLTDVLDGFDVDTNGVIDLRFAPVDFQRLTLWLTRAHPGWGYRVAQLSLDAAERSGTVTARLRLEPANG